MADSLKLSRGNNTLITLTPKFDTPDDWLGVVSAVINVKNIAVNDAIAKLSSPNKEAAQISWEYNATISRASTLIKNLAPALGLNDAAIDELFKQAAKL